MPKTSIEMREERATLVAEARKTYDLAEARDGGATEADTQAFDAAMAGAEELRTRYTRLEKLEAAEADLEAPAERRGKPIERETAERRGEAETAQARTTKLEAYRHWLRTGQVREALRPEARAAAEHRDLTIESGGSNQGGSNLITPVQISSDIVRQMDNFVYIRELCRAAGSITTVTSAQKLGIRSKTARMNAADWTTEIAAVTNDTAMVFGRRDLEPTQLSKLAKVSLRTLILSQDAEREVNDELAYQFSVTQENVFLNGTGSGQPLGVFVASASGISTGRDVVASGTAGAGTTFTGDNLIDMKYSLKRPYRADASIAWMVSREFVKRARKLKVASTTGGNDLEYIWQPGLTGGAPDRILDIPYNESEYAPNTFTTGLYVAVLGCFRYFRIAELPDIAIQRLVELYAATGEVGFIGRHFVDGAPVLEEAFSRLKMA